MKVEYLDTVGFHGGIEQNAFFISTCSDLNCVKSSQKKIVLIGIGKDSFVAETIFERIGLSIYAYADNSDRLVGKVIREKRIISPNELYSDDDVFFVITVHDNNIYSVRLQLMINGIEDYGIFAVYSSHIYNEDVQFREKLLTSMNYISFHEESIESGMPYVPHASGGQYGGKIGCLNWLLTSTLWHHHVCRWSQELIMNKTNSSILEIGPGYGLLSFIILNTFSDVNIEWLMFEGDDIEKDGFNKSLRKIKDRFSERVCCRYGVIEMDDTLPGGTYDLVIMTEVFEHFAVSPVQTMQRIGEALNKDGRILLTTPDSIDLHTYNSWNEIPRKECVDMKRYMELLRCGHVYQYKKEELEEILGLAGLEIERYKQSDSGNHNILIKKA